MLLVADVLSFQGDIPDDALKDWTDGVKAFHEARTKAPSDRDDPASEAAAAHFAMWKDKFPNNIGLLKQAHDESVKLNSGHKALVGNFKLMRATSAMLVNHSGPKGAKKRLGLKHGVHASGAVLGEYVLGGWCIGNIIDSKASPAARASGVLMPGSMGLNVNVCGSGFRATSCSRATRTLLRLKRSSTVPR